MHEKPVPYVEPQGRIVEAGRDGTTSRLVVSFDRMDSGPVAPAGLYVDPRSGDERFPLHRVVKQEGLVFHFETFNCSQPLPAVGENFAYRGWWLPEAMNAALDVEAVWEHRDYSKDGTHQHCLFTWKTIGEGGEESGWWSAKFGWICEQAHHDSIVHDIYRLRQPRHA